MKWRQIALLSAAELLVMTLWFSASAVLPQLKQEWRLDGAAQAWLTMSVQLGFVIGALASAVLNLADRIDLGRFIAGSAALAALATAAIPSCGPSAAILLRIVTGVALAGVYPPGMKLIASWCRTDRGLGIGILVGALTIGSAGPHLLNAIGDGMPPWRSVLHLTAGLGLAGAVLAGAFLRAGPHLSQGAPFDARYAWRALADRPTRLANLGYLGHMWELYAMWAWAPVLLMASYQRAGFDAASARLAGFCVVASGAAGCVVGGLFADRIGRTVVAGASLLVSGLCAALVGFFFDSPVLLTTVCLVWGVAVVADSAQFSAAVSELSDPRYVGSALTLQTCLGFLLTLGSIRLVPWLVDRFGWERAFWFLVPGPVVGAVAMARLRALPAARRMASGHR